MSAVSAKDLTPMLIAQRAVEQPDGLFIQHVDGRRITFGDFQKDVMRWASALRALGIARGDNVLSMQPNCPEAYHSWLGLCWLGAVEVSLNTTYRGRMLHYTADWSDAKVMIVLERYLEQLVEVAGELPKLETVVVPDATRPVTGLPQRVVTSEELFDGITEDGELTPPQPWDISAIIWTSGTTGPSKGVMVPWGSLVSSEADRFFDRGGATYHFWSPFHMGGKSQLYSAMLADVTPVMREAFSVSQFWDDVRQFGITHCMCTESMARMLQSAPPRDDDADNPLRVITPYPVFPDVRDFMNRFGIEVCNTGYGMTELGQLFLFDEDFPPSMESCGRLRDCLEVRIVDSHDYPVPVGEVGELIVRGRDPWTLNSGYYRMPEETLKAWTNGWFHTGDAFRCDENGFYYFIDRIKDAIRRRGENISSFDVESYVNEHPDVLECAAIAVPSELGEDEVKVVAVKAAGSALTASALVEWLSDRMPKFMIPRYVEFTDDLPKTPTLKVQKAKLRETALNERTWDREARP